MDDYTEEIKNDLDYIIGNNENPDELIYETQEVMNNIDINKVSVKERVAISSYALKLLTEEQRISLCKAFIMQQVVKQREKLIQWSLFTGQTGMIDTGYISQHLVSLCTQISGQGMKGKGLDLVDKSEIKSANIFDSKDKKGKKGSRWNLYTSKNGNLEDYLHYKNIYFLSIDLSKEENIRIRIWKLDPKKHTTFRKRYMEWMKNENVGSRNFQMFPPKSGEDSIDAHHGSNKKKDSLPLVQIPLENVAGTEKIFHAEVVDEEVKIIKFKS